MNRDRLRRILSSDPVWSVYALGDLAEPWFPQCSWFVSEPSTLALLFKGADPPVLFGTGDPAPFAELLREVAAPRVYLQIPTHLLPPVQESYSVKRIRSMWRMRLHRFTPVEGATVRLARQDLARLERLYADGIPAAENPDFFFPEMIETGTFFGVEDGGELVAVAGTHIAAPGEGVAAIGNVYTHRNHRQRGYAARATSAVVAKLQSQGIATIALNVIQPNHTARRVYERLGFVTHCEYYEGLAERR